VNSGAGNIIFAHCIEQLAMKGRCRGVVKVKVKVKGRGRKVELQHKQTAMLNAEDGQRASYQMM
jgi:hypothetical protein